MIKRYDYGLVTTGIGEWYELTENPDGDLVKYEDHKKVVDSLEKAVGELTLVYLEYLRLKDLYDELDFEMKGLQK
jgi:hypothetical protein